MTTRTRSRLAFVALSLFFSFGACVGAWIWSGWDARWLYTGVLLVLFSAVLGVIASDPAKVRR